MAVYEWDVTVSYLIIKNKKKKEKEKNRGIKAPEIKLDGSALTRWPECGELRAAVLVRPAEPRPGAERGRSAGRAMSDGCLSPPDSQLPTAAFEQRGFHSGLLGSFSLSEKPQSSSHG